MDNPARKLISFFLSWNLTLFKQSWVFLGKYLASVLLYNDTKYLMYRNKDTLFIFYLYSFLQIRHIISKHDSPFPPDHEYAQINVFKLQSCCLEILAYNIYFTHAIRSVLSGKITTLWRHKGALMPLPGSWQHPQLGVVSTRSQLNAANSGLNTAMEEYKW